MCPCPAAGKTDSATFVQRTSRLIAVVRAFGGRSAGHSLRVGASWTAVATPYRFWTPGCASPDYYSELVLYAAVFAAASASGRIRPCVVIQRPPSGLPRAIRPATRLYSPVVPTAMTVDQCLTQWPTPNAEWSCTPWTPIVNGTIAARGTYRAPTSNGSKVFHSWFAPKPTVSIVPASRASICFYSVLSGIVSQNFIILLACKVCVSTQVLVTYGEFTIFLVYTFSSNTP